MHSLAEWMVYFLECEIKKAYIEHKQKLKSNNKNAQPKQSLTFYNFVKENYKDQAKIKLLLQKVIIENIMKDDNKQGQNFSNKKNFYLTKSIDRLSQYYDKQEYLIQFSWLYEGENQHSQIFQKISVILYKEYEQWKEDKQIQWWKEEKQKERQKKIEKRKRKREKRDKDKVNEESGQEQNEDRAKQGIKSQKKQEEEKQMKKLNQEIKQEKKGKAEETEGQNEKVKQAQKHPNKKLIEVKTSKKQPKIELGMEVRISSTTFQLNEPRKLQKQQEDLSRKEHKFQQQDEQEEIKQKKEKDLAKVIHNHPNKKVIKQRINQYYQFFCQQLSQTAATYDKYRKVVFSVIGSFFSEEFFKEKLIENSFKELNWRLEVYGSAAAGFSLRHSDIDIVLLVDYQKITLYEIFEKLKLKQWAIDCKYINAQIPIITLQVNLNLSHIAFNQLTPKQFKKIQGELFSVDLTLSNIVELHSGIQNTKQLKEIFETYPSIRNVCLLLKQYLRVKNLHKPYKGGINSYILIMLVHAILSRKGIIPPKDEHIANDEYRKIKEISSYMEQQFKPFETVISWNKKSTTKPDKTIHLNIVNPKNEQLLKTSAFNIENIVMELKKFREFQQNMEKQLQCMNINEKKNMKSFFLKEFSKFLQADLD